MALKGIDGLWISDVLEPPVTIARCKEGTEQIVYPGILHERKTVSNEGLPWQTVGSMPHVTTLPFVGIGSMGAMIKGSSPEAGLPVTQHLPPSRLLMTSQISSANGGGD